MSEIQIRILSVEEILPLRHKVLRPHQPLDACKYPEDQRLGTFHIGAISGGQVVGAATFHEQAHPELPARNPWRLRGMATDFPFHQKGIGRQVLEKGIEELRRRGCDLLWCNARVVAFPFYERLGLMYQGPLFDIPGIGPHKVMYKYLT